MTHILAVWGVAGPAIAWHVCCRWHRALHLDRDLHEQAAHLHGDALHRAERRIERWINHPGIPARAHRIRERSMA